MQDLYNRVVALIGKSGEDLEVRLFLEELKEMPIPVGSMSCFPVSGFYLSRRFAIISGALFPLKTPAVEAGTILPFSGVLPFGIAVSDNKHIVLTKIGLKPIGSQTPIKKVVTRDECHQNVDTFELPNSLILEVSYDSAGNSLAALLIRPSVKDLRN
ncbi:MAG: hypothetical protein P4L53_24540 [Candidatus Obscuribacterales bacterium]|nr:hypothetical protein [Candidatus Obscuribacterales bacterium]